jgi:hypothetical protein
MADNEMKTVSDAIAETMKLVTTSTALVDHYAGKIKQIEANTTCVPVLVPTASQQKAPTENRTEIFWLPSQVLVPT